MRCLIGLLCGILLLGIVVFSEAAAQPAGSKQDKDKGPREPAEVKVFSMKHLDAAEVIALLQQLFQERDLRLASHKPSNTVLAVGSADKLRLIETIISKLEDTGKKAEKLDIKIVTLKNAQATDLMNTLQQLFQERSLRITADARSNTLLISAAAADDLQTVMAVIKKLDEVTEKAPPVQP